MDIVENICAVVVFAIFLAALLGLFIWVVSAECKKNRIERDYINSLNEYDKSVVLGFISNVKYFGKDRNGKQ